LFNDYTYTAFSSGTFVLAAMTSPAIGSTLPGSTVTFQWTTGTGVSEYWLYISNVVVGGIELTNLDMGTNTSYTKTGLPTDGSTIYVRLWSRSASTGGWSYTDYSYRSF
jgi:serine protease